MNNTPIIYLSLSAVLFFDKPYFDGQEWHNLKLDANEHRTYLSETRAAMLNVPVKMEEEPIAYVYSVYGEGDECYIPAYDRTGLVDTERLYSKEIVSI